MWKAVVDGQRYFCTECKFRPLDGDEVRYELMEVYVPEAHADDYSLVFTTATDITEQKRREEELASAKERYRRILDRSTDYVLIHDEGGDIDYVSPGIEATLGYDPKDLVGTDAFKYVHPADTEKIRGVFAEMLADPETNITTEYRVRSTDDSYRWVEARGSNYLDDPLIDGVMVTIRDITERKQYEQELIAERDARSTLQRELADDTSARTFASAVSTELVSMDTIAAAQVGIITTSETMEVVASDGDSAVISGDSEQHIPTSVSRNLDSQTVTSLFESEVDASPTASTTVPITHDGVTRGVLVVHFAEQATTADTVEPLLQESADVLGYAMASDDRQRALAADEWVQVTLTVGTAQTPLSRIVGAVGTTAKLTAAVTRGDDTVLCYLEGVANTKALVDAARGLPEIERVERLGDGGSTVQVVVSGPVPSVVVATHGGSVEATTVTAETTTLHARVPQGAAFDPMLEALCTRFDDVVTSDFTTAPTDIESSDDPLSGLTARQREVLEIAYRGGYFDKPRTQSASEVADSLGVSRPAYDEVLRAAQRNLLSDLFT
jgi:PAS domain S-box-containing protein